MPLGASWGPLGASWGPLEGLWRGLCDAAWMPLGASWGLLEPSVGRRRCFDRSWTVWDHVELSWRPLGTLLKRSGAVFGALLAGLGRLWARLRALYVYLGDPLGGFLGRSGAGLGGFGAVQGQGAPQKAHV
eukprot:6913796-Pyramimonas_sp.AAC.1